jgi:hypothetical protein
LFFISASNVRIVPIVISTVKLVIA